ncbi:hypothetical protein RB195_002766 [Necator americanus]|uniref:ERAP1-like C-terminal domain-containing protein n=1 Tax=Necator americanus TaxID=51031 RepID=A0ABR1DKK6_NECAM
MNASAALGPLASATRCTTQCFYPLKQVQRLLEILEANGKLDSVRSQDILHYFFVVYRTAVGHEFLFEFCTEHWDLIYKRLKSYLTILERVISFCFGTIHTHKQINQAKAFQKSIENANNAHVISKELERAEHRILWLEKHSKNLVQYFKSKTNQSDK